jgi:hypothetical protein
MPVEMEFQTENEAPTFGGISVKISPIPTRGASRQACRVGCRAEFSKADPPKGRPVGPARVATPATRALEVGLTLTPMPFGGPAPARPAVQTAVVPTAVLSRIYTIG